MIYLKIFLFIFLGIGSFVNAASENCIAYCAFMKPKFTENVGIINIKSVMFYKLDKEVYQVSARTYEGLVRNCSGGYLLSSFKRQTIPTQVTPAVYIEGGIYLSEVSAIRPESCMRTVVDLK